MRVRTGLVILTLALAGSLGLTTRPASASVDDCPRGSVCLYQHRDAQGVIKKFQYTQGYGNFTYLICLSCSEGDFNDDMSSWVNNSSYRYCWYFDTAWTPTSGTRGPRPMPPQFGRIVNVTSFENDQASSIARC
jgi:hypothetical protein